jgi:SOS response regulatory protein OraA/RecX
MATCLDYSLGYIHIYPKTEQELRTKLYTKKYTEEEIDRTITFLASKWYINDLQFTQLYIQSEIIKKGKLPALVKAKLIHKWVDKSIINQVMESKEEEMDAGVHNRIRKEIEKYKNKGLEWYEIMVKISAKWYRISDIRKAIKEWDDE